MSARRGFTLLELIVVMAIMAVLIGLLIPAVQKVRDAAARMRDISSIRQVALSIHGYADSHSGRLPVSDGGYRSAYYVILPHLDHGNYYKEVESLNRPYNNDYVMKMYISSKDPTLDSLDAKKGTASFVYNAHVFVPEVSNRLSPNVSNTFADGQSNTVILTEHYALNCGNHQFMWMTSASPRTFDIEGTNYTLRRSSFADVGDVRPNSVNPPTVTFQVRPAISDCDPRMPQAPFDAGLLVGLADGSVRTVRHGVSPATFWAAVTPAGGETLGPDW